MRPTPRCGHFHVFALVFQEVPERGDAAEVAVVDQDGRPAVDQQHAFQAARLFRRQVGGIADDLFQPDCPGLQQPADGLALAAEVRFPGRPDELRLGHGRGRVRLGGGVRPAVGPPGPAHRRPHVGRLLPAAHLLAILPDDVQHVVEPFAETFADPLHDHLPAIHANPPSVAGRRSIRRPRPSFVERHPVANPTTKEARKWAAVFWERL